MNKLLIAIAATFLAVTTLFASAAEAGFNVRMGGAPSQFSTVHKAGCGGGGGYRRRSRQSRRVSLASKRRAKAAVIARAQAKSRARAKAKVVAKAKIEAEDEVAETENSSISAADEKVAEANTDEPTKTVASAKELGCKKFFPSVAMTLTVPCE